jgi:predicted RNase H-like HicB family nuclease
MTSRDWSIQDKLSALMRLPWQISLVRDPIDGTLVAEVAELPDAVATGDTEAELSKQLWEALSESLLSRLEHGDQIPLPPRGFLPWEAGKEPPVPVELVPLRHLMGADRDRGMPCTAAPTQFATAI